MVALQTTRYRADIDGLRGVAIILVLLFHLRPALVPGGFLGVDVFFVISGFVVTRSVLGAPPAAPLAAMLRFWRRRLLRIVPALLFMIGGTYVAMALLSPPFPKVTYVGAIRTGLSAIIGFGNLYLYRGRQDYFRDDQSSNPFLHTWSLAVEEQFYLLFSLLFLGALGLVIRRRGNSPARLMMAGLGTLSVIGFLRSAEQDPSATYYLLPYRFWEIALGSALAYWESAIASHVSRLSSPSIRLFQAVALAVICASAWRPTKGLFPTSVIVAATVSSAVLVATGEARAAIVSKILRRRLMVHIGLLSYSLYLWHYPVLFMWRSYLGVERLSDVVFALFSIILFAAVSYYAVERPFRHGSGPFLSRSLPMLSGMIVVICLLYLRLDFEPGRYYLGSAQNWDGEWLRPNGVPYMRNGRVTFADCNLQSGAVVPPAVPAGCISRYRGTAGVDRMLLVIGDSHAFSDWGMAAYGAEAGRYVFATLVHDGCSFDPARPGRSMSCATYWEQMPQLIRETIRPGDSVLLSLLWPIEDLTNFSVQTAELQKLSSVVEQRGGELIVEAPLPRFSRPAYLCTQEPYRVNYMGCTKSRAEFELARKEVVTMLRTLSASSHLRVWDPLDQICEPEVCTQFADKKPVFRDTNHLSYYGSSSLGRAFLTFWDKSR